MGFLVPQSGRIKKVKVKILSGEKDASSHIFQSGSIFTIISIKDTGEVSNLLSYECFFIDNTPIGECYIFKECGFDRDMENIPTSEGDVINIRTEKYFNEHIFRGHDDNFSDVSYLFTFLIVIDIDRLKKRPNEI